MPYSQGSTDLLDRGALSLVALGIGFFDRQFF